ncbi:MAG: futalosine hydrolase [Planctomycetota bacterium]|jgi:futalosine hydrolase
MRLLIVTSVPAEAEAIGSPEPAQVVVSGIGRTNAAAATTEAIIRQGPFDAVLSAGVAGALPGSGLSVGQTVIATKCVYAEEGLITPEGFLDLTALGFSLGDFTGNVVPVQSRLLSVLRSLFRAGPIATVATCSGSDAAADEVVRRTGAVAEAMEGAAVVHAARRLGVPGIEVRAISNTAGDRDRQVWRLPAALAALHEAVHCAVDALREG